MTLNTSSKLGFKNSLLKHANTGMPWKQEQILYMPKMRMSFEKMYILSAYEQDLYEILKAVCI